MRQDWGQEHNKFFYQGKRNLAYKKLNKGDKLGIINSLSGCKKQCLRS